MFLFSVTAFHLFLFCFFGVNKALLSTCPGKMDRTFIEVCQLIKFKFSVKSKPFAPKCQ